MNRESWLNTILADRYLLQEILGSGGFAVVYRGLDQLIEREVAIKVLDLNIALDREQATKRFLHEARAAARINHPNVVTIHDIGLQGQGDAPFIVMELLEGHDLGVALERHGAMHPERALARFTEALRALAEAMPGI
ncbi:MAG: protein kinase [Myxococcota bacterium]